MYKLSDCILFLLVTILFTSCGTYAYKSVTPKTVLFSDKNDIHAQGNISAGGNEGFIAYAPLKNVGFSASVAGYKKDSVNRFLDAEFSVIPFAKKGETIVEMPVGFAISENVFLNNPFVHQVRYRRYFIQPEVGTRNDNVDFAAFLRISYIDYDRLSWGADVRLEPGMMVRFGIKNVKLMLSGRLDIGSNYSKNKANLPMEYQVRYMPLHLSLGLHFNLNLKRKKTD